MTVDWLPPVILIGLYAPEPALQIHTLAAGLRERFPHCESIQLQHRYHSAGRFELIWGRPVNALTVVEDGLRFGIRLGQCRNTGLFLDMGNGRRWVRRHSLDMRVLNLFAYTCGFSVAAVAGGARTVVNVDMSSAALSNGRENHRLNRQPLDAVHFEKLDIFKSFGRLRRRGPFNLLICDPPTRQKGSVDIVRDYPRILRRLDEFMAPASRLLLCLNAPGLGAEFLTTLMQELAPAYRLEESIPPPAEFAEAQGKGLKTLHYCRHGNRESDPPPMTADS